MGVTGMSRTLPEEGFPGMRNSICKGTGCRRACRTLGVASA
ncbi:SPATA32 isoform 2 [Pongo abelii]|uniref:SPATA32 isoform 2 n=1 Tax=Pongo abelii TaxID=9601 RepID=A0A2J8UYX4_PONAB|nr:SPATA32 isoform 2 [Pongo abelii]